MAAWVLAGPAAAAIQLPPDFVVETLPFVFDVPTAIAFLPDGGLLVAEKGGIVYVVRGNQRWSMWVHEEEVLNTDDRGLLGIAVDPDFVTNRRLYFLFTADPDSNGIELDNYDDTFSRLVRYQVSVGDPNVVDETTRKVLIGASWAQGFPSASGHHSIADLEWGADKSLLVSAGDGAHYEEVDSGGLDPGQFTPGRTDPNEDIGAFRAQDLRSLNGKVLRIDPETGLGYASNPYYDGNPASNRSRVWCYGLRNPFRIARKPGTGSPNPAEGKPGTLYIADVGWSTWEEIDVAATPGRNYGWPCFEGPGERPDYQIATPSHHGCASPGSPENPALPSAPLASFHHLQPELSTPPGVQGVVIVGGEFKTTPGYPPPYQGGYFFGDYAQDWIKVLKTDTQDQVTGLADFATGADGPVSFAIDPVSGDLYYAAIYTGEVRRIRYTGVLEPPDGQNGPVLWAPRPNPSQGPTTFSLDLSATAPVRFSIFDLAGREVWRTPEIELGPGRHELFWPGLDGQGGAVGNGVYVARAESGGRTATRLVAVVR